MNCQNRYGSDFENNRIAGLLVLQDHFFEKIGKTNSVNFFLPDITIATVGNVDSGKSTLVGVLTRSILDDGRGLARSKVR